MKYISTRGNYEKVESMEAIKLGMVPEGGLFVPEVIPEFTPEDIESMEEKKYQEIAYMVLNKYLTDYEGDVLQKLIAKAYNQDNFPVENRKDWPLIFDEDHQPKSSFQAIIDF